jgi:hypothetical protein
VGDAGADAGGGVCGRVVYSDFHVSTSAFVSGWGTCVSNSQCGYGSTCSGGQVGTCTPETCATTADCPDNTYSCSGGKTGKCQEPATQCTKNKQCYSGTCNKGKGLCVCANSSDCGGSPCVGGFCGDSNTACTNSNQCPGNEVCNGGTSGTCTHTCTKDSDCTGGELCESGQCTGCNNRWNCPSNSCSGASQGTCSGNSSEFPNACSQGPLDVQESALEFMLLDLTACISPDNQPPPGPPTPVTVYNPVSFTVDFQSSCPVGTHVIWRELDWQATIPNTASIVFAGQTAPAAADGGIPNYSGVQSATIATATTTTPNLPTGWNMALIDTTGADAGSQGAFNTASPPITSQTDLRLTVTLNPTTAKDAAPTLIQWQVKSDCYPSE